MLRSRKSKSRRLALETRRLLVQPLEVRQMLSINEPPTIAPVGPQNLVRDDNTGILPQLVFSSGNQNLIVVDDVDAGGAALEVSLEAEHGVLSLSQVAGLTFLEGDGSDDATISFTGSLANINAALAGMQFDAEQTFSGVGTLTVTVDDLGNTGDGGPKQASHFVNIGVDHVDAAPLVSVPPRAFVTLPATGLLVTGVSITDPDAGDAPISLQVWSRQQGLVTVKTDVPGGIVPAQVTGNSTTSAYIVAPLSAINATLTHAQGVVYHSAAGYDGREVLWFNADDLGNTGSLNPNTGRWHNEFVEIRVTQTASISAPEVQSIGLNNDVPFSWQTGNQVVIVDPVGGSPTLTVSMSAADGTLTLQTIDPPTFSQGGNGQSQMTFSGSLVDLNAWLNSLVFTPTPGFAGVATLSIGLNGGAGASLDARTINIAIAHSNHSPRGEATTEVVGYRTTGGPLPNITLSDPDGLNGRMRFAVHADHGGFEIETDVPGGIGQDQINWQGDTGFGVTATLAEMNATLAAGGIIYRPVVGYSGPDRVSLSIDDRGNSGPGGNRWGGVNVDVWVVDGVAVSHPGPQTAADRDVVFSRLNGNRIVVFNTEPTTDVAVTLAATHGRLTLGSTSGLSNVTGGNTAVVSLSGSLAAVNSALEGLIYHPDANYSGSASIDIDVEDVDQPSVTASGTIAITVDHINRPPNVGFVNREFVVGVDRAMPLGGISLSDADAGSGEIYVRLQVSRGTLHLNGAVANGIQLGEIIQNDASVVLVASTQARLNATLQAGGLEYTPDLGYEGGDYLMIVLGDQGNSGTGGGQAGLRFARIAVGDRPAIVLPVGQHTPLNRTLAFNQANNNRLTIADPSASASDLLDVTISAAHALLSLGHTDGIEMLGGTMSSGGPSISMRGTLSALNNALDGFMYLPNRGYSGPDELTIGVMNPALSVGSQSTSRVLPIAVDRLNTPPRVQVAQRRQPFEVGTPIAITGLSVHDADAGDSPLIVRAFNSGGTLVVSDSVPGGLRTGQVVSFGSDAVVLIGSQTEINATLAGPGGVTFTPYSGFDGFSWLGIDASDQGASGAGGQSYTLQLVGLEGPAANRAPVITAPGLQEVNENSGFDFSLANNNLVSVSDDSLPEGFITVGVWAERGTVSVSSNLPPEVQVSPGGGEPVANLVLEGAVAAVNAALATLHFEAEPGFVGEAGIRVGATDLAPPGPDEDIINLVAAFIPIRVHEVAVPQELVFVSAGVGGSLTLSSADIPQTIREASVEHVFFFDAEEDETLSVWVKPLGAAATLAPVVWLHGPDGGLLDSHVAEAGNEARLNDFPLPSTGRYTLKVGGDESTGSYRLSAVRNAVVSHDHAGNQSGVVLSDTAISFGANAARYSAIGQAEGLRRLGSWNGSNGTLITSWGMIDEFADSGDEIPGDPLGRHRVRIHTNVQNHGLVEGDHVVIRGLFGFNAQSTYSGEYSIAAVDLGSFDLNVPFDVTASFEFGTWQFVPRVTATYGAVQSTTIDDDGIPRQLALIGRIAQDGGVDFVDVTNPSQPAFVTNFRHAGPLFDVEAIFAVPEADVGIFPSFTRVTTSAPHGLRDGQTVRLVRLEGSGPYVGEFRIFNVSPSAFDIPLLYDTAPTGTYQWQDLSGNMILPIAVDGDRAFLGSRDGGGIFVVDLGNAFESENPVVEVGRIHPSVAGHPTAFDSVFDLKIAGDYLYVTGGLESGGDEQAQVLVYNKNTLALVAAIETGEVGALAGLQVQGNRLYVSSLLSMVDPGDPAAGWSGFTRIIDLTNVFSTGSTSTVARLDTGFFSSFSAATPDGNHLVVTHLTIDEASGQSAPHVSIWDISNPSQPVLAASLDAADYGLTASSSGVPLIVDEPGIGLRLYVSWFGAGVLVFDIDDPAQPELVANWGELPPELNLGLLSGMFGLGPQQGSTLLATDFNNGLYVLDRSPDVQTYTLDLAGQQGQRLDITLKSVDGTNLSDESLELIDPLGNVVATAVSTIGGGAASNFQLSLLGFEVPDPVPSDPESGNQYTLRATSNRSGRYNLLVTKQLVVLPQVGTLPMRSLDGVAGAIGRLNGGADHFTVTLQPGQSLIATTQTPLDSIPDDLPGSARNRLNPRLELRTFQSGIVGELLASDEDSASGDDRNAELHFTRTDTTEGALTFVLVVFAEEDAPQQPTSGDYIVRLNTTGLAGPTTTGIPDQHLIAPAASASVYLPDHFDDAIDGDNLSYSVSSAAGNVSTGTQVSAGTLIVFYGLNQATASDTFTVRATNSAGLFVEATFHVYLTAPFDAEIVAQPIGAVGQQLLFRFGIPADQLDDLPPAPNPSQAYSYVIDWNDGSTSGPLTRDARPFTLEHAYAQDGVYQVTVRATNAFGRESTLGAATLVVSDSSRVLNGTLRDFKADPGATGAHPDFEFDPVVAPASSLVLPELVQPHPTEPAIPVFAGVNGQPEQWGGIHSAVEFSEWFRDTTNINQSLDYPLIFAETAPGSRVFEFSARHFFPLDGKLFGNEGEPFNQHFTLTARGEFVAGPNQFITYSSDDDLWVFVDGHLAIDHGGVHGATEHTYSFNSLGLTAGTTHTIELFYADRHTPSAELHLRTNIEFNRDNLAPVHNVPGPQFTNASRQVIFSQENGNRLYLSDADAGSGELKVTLTASAGAVTLETTAGLAFVNGDGVADSALTVLGDLSELNAALEGLTYTAAASGLGYLTLTTNDLGNTGQGGAKETTSRVRINVVPFNATPEISLAVESFLSSPGAWTNLPTFSASDADASDTPYRLRMSVAHGELSVDDAVAEGPSDTEISQVSAREVEVIAPLLELNALLSAPGGVRYRNELPTGVASLVDWVLVEINDLNQAGIGGERMASAKIEVQVTDDVLPPVLTLPQGALTVTSGDDLAISGLMIRTLDPSNPQIELTFAVGRGVLTWNASPGVQSAGSGTGLLTISGSFSDVASAISLPDAVVYRSDDSVGGLDAMQVHVERFVSNGPSLIAEGSVTIAVVSSAIDDPLPLNQRRPQLQLPGQQTVAAGQAMTLSAATQNAIVIANPREAGADLEVTLSATNGAIFLSTVEGLTHLRGTSFNSDTQVFRAPVSAVNRALDGLIFLPTGKVAAAASISVSVTDLQGVGDALWRTASGAVSIRVIEPEAPLTLLVPGPLSVFSDGELSLGGANAIQLYHPSLGNREVVLHLRVEAPGSTFSAGQLAFGVLPSGVSVSYGNIAGDDRFSLQGTIGDLNAALSGLSFLPGLRFAGVANLVVETQDVGQTVGGVSQRIEGSVPITVQHVTLTPRLRVPSVQSVRQNETLAFNAADRNSIAVDDPDAVGGELHLSIVASIGGLTLGAGAPATELNVIGSSGAINAALDTLAYFAPVHRTGGATLALELRTSGGNLLDQATVGIQIRASSASATPYNNVPDEIIAYQGQPLDLSPKFPVRASVDPATLATGTEITTTLGTSHGLLTLENRSSGNLASAGPREVTPGSIGGTPIIGIPSAADQQAGGRSLAMLPDGRLIVAFIDTHRQASPASQSDQVNLRSFAGDGTPSDTVVVAQYTAPPSLDSWFATDARIAANPSGEFVVTWVETESVGNRKLWAARGHLTALGLPTLDGAAFVMASGALTSHAVAIDGAGTFVAVWSSGDNMTIRAFPSAGSGYTPSTVYSESLPSPDNLDVAINDQGEVIVAWDEVFDINLSRRQVTVERYQVSNPIPGSSTELQLSRQGAAGVDGLQTSPNATDSQFDPAVAIARDGRFVVAWTSSVPGMPSVIMAQPFSPDGTKREGAFAVDGEDRTTAATVGFEQDSPVVSMNQLGTFAIAWDQFTSPSSGAVLHAVGVRRFDSSGRRWGDWEIQPVLPTAPTHPSVGVDSLGQFALGWTAHDGTNHSASTVTIPLHDVYVQQFADALYADVAVSVAVAVGEVLELSGPVEKVNTALAAVRYIPEESYLGSDMLAIESMRSVVISAGPPEVAELHQGTNVVPIEVVPRITAPRHLAPTSVVVETQVPFRFEGAAGVAIERGGPADQLLQLKLEATRGQFTLDGRYWAPTMLRIGTLAELNAALAELTFVSEPTGAGELLLDAALRIVTSDLGSGPSGLELTADTTIAIEVIGLLNHPPTITVPPRQSVLQGQPLAFTAAVGNGIVIDDVDVGTGHIEVALEVGHGTLALAQTMDLEFLDQASSGSRRIHFRGTLAAVNEALSGLRYESSLAYSGFDELAISVDDLGNGGTAPARIAMAAIPLRILPRNRTPQVLVPEAQRVAQNGRLAFSSRTANPLRVSDADAGRDELSLQVTAEHGSVRLVNGGAVRILLNSGGQLMIRGELGALNAALEGLVFEPDAGFMGEAVLRLSIDDGGDSSVGGPRSDAGELPILVDQVNQPPEVFAPQSVALAGDGQVVFSAEGTWGGIAIADSDAGAAPLRLSLQSVGGAFSASHVPQSVTTVSGSVLDSRSVVILGSLADVNGFLNGLAWKRSATFVGQGSLSIIVDDLGGASGEDPRSATATVRFNGTLGALFPPILSTTEDTPLTLSASGGNLIQLTSSQSAAPEVAFTVWATGGQFQFIDPLPVGVTATGNNTDGAFLAVVGPLAAVNEALDGAVFEPQADLHGTAQLRFVAEALTGGGVAEAFQGQVAISVSAVDDAPQVVTPIQQGVAKNAPLTLGATAGNRVRVVDADGHPGPLVVRLSAPHGKMTLPRRNEVLFDVGAGVDEPVMVFRGDLVNVNEALEQVVYTPRPGFVGTDELTFELFESAGASSVPLHESTVTLSVASGLGSPTIRMPGMQTTVALNPLSFGSITGNSIAIDAPEAGSDEVTVAIAVTDKQEALAGMLNVQPTLGATVAGGSLPASTLTLTGSVKAINATLQTLTWTPDVAPGATSHYGINTSPYELSIDLSDNGRNDSALSSVAPTAQMVRQAITIIQSSAIPQVANFVQGGSSTAYNLHTTGEVEFPDLGPTGMNGPYPAVEIEFDHDADSSIDGHANSVSGQLDIGNVREFSYIPSVPRSPSLPSPPVDSGVTAPPLSPLTFPLRARTVIRDPAYGVTFFGDWAPINLPGEIIGYASPPASTDAGEPALVSGLGMPSSYVVLGTAGGSGGSIDWFRTDDPTVEGWVSSPSGGGGYTVEFFDENPEGTASPQPLGSTVSDDDGRFVFTAASLAPTVPMTEWTIANYKSLFARVVGAPTPSGYTQGLASISFELVPADTRPWVTNLRLLVVDPDQSPLPTTANPTLVGTVSRVESVQYVKVEVRLQNGGLLGEATTDETGEFTFTPALEPGSYTLEARVAPTGGSGVSESIWTSIEFQLRGAAGKPTISSLQLQRLTDGADKTSDPSLWGVVTYAGGAADIPVEADFNEDGQVDQTVRTDAAGRFFIVPTGLTPGEIKINVRAIGRDLQRDLVVTGDWRDLSFELLPPADPYLQVTELRLANYDSSASGVSDPTVRGAISASTSTAFQTVEFRYNDSPATAGSTLTDGSGQFRFVPTQLSPGAAGTQVHARAVVVDERGVRRTGPWATLEFDYEPTAESVAIDNLQSVGTAASPLLSGHAAGPGSLAGTVIEFDHDTDGVVEGSTTADVEGNFTYAPAFTTGGAYPVRARARYWLYNQVSGQWSSETSPWQLLAAPVSYTPIASAPNIVSFGLRGEDGQIAALALTSDPILIGRAAAGPVAVQIWFGDDSTAGVTVRSDANGVFVYRPQDLTPSPNVTANARTVVAGTAGQPIFGQPSDFTFELLPPARTAPAIDVLILAHETGQDPPGGDVHLATDPTFTGSVTLPADILGVSVEFALGDEEQPTPVGSAAVNSAGQFQFRLFVPDDGPRQARARTRLWNAASHAFVYGPWSAPLHFRIVDPAAQDLPTIQNFALVNPNGPDPVDLGASDSTVQGSVVITAGSAAFTKVEFALIDAGSSDQIIGFTYADANGGFTYHPTGLPLSGEVTLKARAVVPNFRAQGELAGPWQLLTFVRQPVGQPTEPPESPFAGVETLRTAAANVAARANAAESSAASFSAAAFNAANGNTGAGDGSLVLGTRSLAVMAGKAGAVDAAEQLDRGGDSAPPPPDLGLPVKLGALTSAPIDVSLTTGAVTTFASGASGNQVFTRRDTVAVNYTVDVDETAPGVFSFTVLLHLHNDFAYALQELAGNVNQWVAQMDPGGQLPNNSGNLAAIRDALLAAEQEPPGNTNLPDGSLRTLSQAGFYDLVYEEIGTATSDGAGGYIIDSQFDLIESGESSFAAVDAAFDSLDFVTPQAGGQSSRRSGSYDVLTGQGSSAFTHATSGAQTPTAGGGYLLQSSSETWEDSSEESYSLDTGQTTLSDTTISGNGLTTHQRLFDVSQGQAQQTYSFHVTADGRYSQSNATQSRQLQIDAQSSGSLTYNASVASDQLSEVSGQGRQSTNSTHDESTLTGSLNASLAQSGTLTRTQAGAGPAQDVVELEYHYLETGHDTVTFHTVGDSAVQASLGGGQSVSSLESFSGDGLTHTDYRFTDDGLQSGVATEITYTGVASLVSNYQDDLSGSQLGSELTTRPGYISDRANSGQFSTGRTQTTTQQESYRQSRTSVQAVGSLLVHGSGQQRDAGDTHTDLQIAGDSFQQRDTFDGKWDDTLTVDQSQAQVDYTIVGSDTAWSGSSELQATGVNVWHAASETISDHGDPQLLAAPLHVFQKAGSNAELGSVTPFVPQGAGGVDHFEHREERAELDQIDTLVQLRISRTASGQNDAVATYHDDIQATLKTDETWNAESLTQTRLRTPSSDSRDTTTGSQTFVGQGQFQLAAQESDAQPLHGSWSRDDLAQTQRNFKLTGSQSDVGGTSSYQAHATDAGENLRQQDMAFSHAADDALQMAGTFDEMGLTGGQGGSTVKGSYQSGDFAGGQWQSGVYTAEAADSFHSDWTLNGTLQQLASGQLTTAGKGNRTSSSQASQTVTDKGAFGDGEAGAATEKELGTPFDDGGTLDNPFPAHAKGGGHGTSGTYEWIETASATHDVLHDYQFTQIEHPATGTRQRTESGTIDDKTTNAAQRNELQNSKWSAADAQGGPISGTNRDRSQSGRDSNSWALETYSLGDGPEDKRHTDYQTGNTVHARYESEATGQSGGPDSNGPGGGTVPGGGTGGGADAKPNLGALYSAGVDDDAWSELLPDPDDDWFTADWSLSGLSSAAATGGGSLAPNVGPQWPAGGADDSGGSSPAQGGPDQGGGVGSFSASSAPASNQGGVSSNIVQTGFTKYFLAGDGMNQTNATGQADANGDQIIDIGAATRSTAGWNLVGKLNQGHIDSTINYLTLGDDSPTGTNKGTQDWIEIRGTRTSGNGKGSQGYNTNPDPLAAVVTKGDSNDNGATQNVVSIVAENHNVFDSTGPGPNPATAQTEFLGKTVYQLTGNKNSTGDENHTDTRQANGSAARTDHRDGTLNAGDEVYDFGSHFYRSHQHIPLEGRTDDSSYLLAGTTKTTGNAKSEPDLSTDAANDQTGTNKYKGDHKVDTKVFTRQTGSSQVVDPAGLNNSSSSSLLESTVTTVPRVETKFTETHLAGPATSLTTADEQPHAETGETKTLDVKREWKIEESHPQAGFPDRNHPSNVELAKKSIEHRETQFEQQTDADDYHYNTDGTPVSGTSDHTVIKSFDATTVGEITQNYATDYPSGAMQFIMAFGPWYADLDHSKLRDVVTTSTTRGGSYHYDEKSQYEENGKKTGDYDSTDWDYTYTSYSPEVEFVAALPDPTPSIDPGTYVEPPSSWSVTETTTTQHGHHVNDVGHIDGGATSSASGNSANASGQAAPSGEDPPDYVVGPGEEKATPGAQWINQPGVTGQVPQPIEAPQPEQSWWDRLQRWNPFASFADWWRAGQHMSDGVQQESQALGNNRRRMFEMPDHDLMNVPDIQAEIRPRFSEDSLNVMESAAEFNYDNMAGKGFAATAGAGKISKPANAKGVDADPKYSGVGIGDNVPVRNFAQPSVTIRNSHLAGKNHPVTGIPFDADGFPDFSKVSKRQVEIVQSGNRFKDFAEANKKAGYDKTPEDYTWHHHQNGRTMQLVPRDLHKRTGHTGGVGLGGGS